MTSAELTAVCITGILVLGIVADKAASVYQTVQLAKIGLREKTKDLRKVL